MRSFTALLAVSAATLVAAQNFTINPAEVSLTTRAQWCAGETSTCSTLCNGNPMTDSCDPNTLLYACTCQNGSAPGLQYYKQTIPYFVCQQAFSDCINANVGNLNGQTNCTKSIQNNCGTLDPSMYSASGSSSSSSSSSSAAASATSSAASSGSASASASSSASAAATSATSKAGAMPTAMAQYIGSGAAAVAVGALAFVL